MFGSRSLFDKYLEKATSQLLLEPDWESILQITDCIRQGDVSPKTAAAAIKRKVSDANPHVSLYGLQVLESCMKNCGSTIHAEVATREFMEFMKNLVNSRGDPVKSKVLELIQVWSHAFRNESSYRVVQETFNILKLEGHSFPQLKESDAMFSAEKAPEWKDADCCSRCRAEFGLVQRKHHCRACGDVVCGKCSSKNSIIPKFGIEKEVRVCDSCYDKLNKAGSKGGEDELPAEYLNSPLSKQSQVPAQKSEQEIQEEEELQLAIALSKSEEENKAKERERLRNNYGIYGGGSNVTKEPTRNASPVQSKVVEVSAPMVDSSDMDPELARYLNRNYWQQKSETIKTTTTTQPSAPVAQPEAKATQGAGKVQEAYQNGETEEDPDQFLSALNRSVEIFVNRMKSNSARGRSIANDSSVQSLFNVISNMHPQLLKYVQGQEDLRAHYESLQDKLAQLRDAREALDALREDHREKRRREMEEMERQRQIQMALKLDIMRQKKHEYLEMQRQLALQRLQEQEREMQARFEQQRQLTQMRQMQAYGYNQAGYPQGGMPGGVPQQGYNPAAGPNMEGSPIHQMQGPGHMGPGQMQGPGQIQMGPYMGQVSSSQQRFPPPQQQPNYSQAGAASQAGSMYQSLPSGVAMMSGGQLPQQYLSQTDGPSQHMGPGGYHMDPNYTQQGAMQYNAGGQSLPPGMGGHGTSPNPGYQSMGPASMPEYQQGPYNMQAMGGALPPVDNQGYGAQQQQQQPSQQQHQQQQQYIGPTGQVPQYQGQGHHPQNLAPQHQPGPNEAALISFD